MRMKAYTVNAGHRFVVPANNESGIMVVEAGGTVYLDAAEALRFADRVTAKPSKAAATVAADADAADTPAHTPAHTAKAIKKK